MKKGKIIASSLLSIVMCSSLIAGATYALFTDTSTVNIAVTSAKVDVEATVDNSSVKMYSATTSKSSDQNVNYDEIDTTDLDLGNFNGNYYYKPITYSTTDNKGTFTNGGTATLKDDTITLDKITAGDKVTFSIDVANNSDVTIQYRTVISCSGDTTLFSGLKFTVDEVDFSQVSLYKSAYQELKVGKGNATVNISVELPLDAGNIYQNNKSTTISYKIEAVQGNADTSSGSEAYYEYAPVGAEGLELTSENLTYLDKDGNVTTKSQAAGITLTSANIKTTAADVVIPAEIDGVKVTSIGENIFGGNGTTPNQTIKSVVIPDTVTAIGDYAFDNCWELETVVLPNGITEIPQFCFNACPKLKNITIPENVETIGKEAFSTCRALTEVEIPGKVNTIGEKAFYGDDVLEKVVLNEGLEIIEMGAFGECFSLKSVTIPSTVTSIGVKAFSVGEGMIDSNNQYKQLCEIIPDLPVGTTTFTIYYSNSIEKARELFTKVDEGKDENGNVFRGETNGITYEMPTNIVIYCNSTGNETEDELKNKDVLKYKFVYNSNTKEIDFVKVEEDEID